MSVTKIAKRYAQALLSIATKSETEPTIEKDFLVLRELMKSSSDLRILMRSPVIRGWRKKKILEELLTGKVSGPFMDFLSLVIDRGRDEYYTTIDTEFHRLLDTKRGIVRATVTSANALDTRLEDEVSAALSKKTGKNVVATFTVEPLLIGGVKVMMEDTVLDGSVRQQLLGLQKKLVNG